MIRWKDDYSTGIALVDEQHKRLFAIADQVYTLMRDRMASDKYDRIIAVLGQLREYTVFHFHAEEQYMQSINYPHLVEHQEEHRRFIDKLSAIDLSQIDQHQSESLIKLLDFVVTWIANHVLQMDKRITAG